MSMEFAWNTQKNKITDIKGKEKEQEREGKITNEEIDLDKTHLIRRGNMSMEFAWNTQKNKITDIKGKEKEQEREGKITNEEIDLDKTHLNYDLEDY